MYSGTLFLDSQFERVSYFVNPQFNLVAFLSLYFVFRPLTGVFSWVIDLFAAGYLLYGTHTRAGILLHTQKRGVLSEDEFYVLFVSSLASWIAAVILESRTCIHTWNKIRSVVSGESRRANWKNTVIVQFFAFNSALVIILFCKDVAQTVWDKTSDEWLILYHFAASAAKVFSTFFQGVFLVKVKQHYPVNNVIDGHFLLRMAFINIITCIHSIYLIFFGGFSSLFSIRSALLVLDLAFRFCLCLSYLRSYYYQKLLHCLNTAINTCFSILRCSQEEYIISLVSARNCMDMGSESTLDQEWSRWYSPVICSDRNFEDLELSELVVTSQSISSLCGAPTKISPTR